MIVRLLIFTLIINVTCPINLSQHDSTFHTSTKQNYDELLTKVNSEQSHELPTYSIYLNSSPLDRYKQLINDKKTLLNEFIDYLYQMNKNL